MALELDLTNLGPAPAPTGAGEDLVVTGPYEDSRDAARPWCVTLKRGDAVAHHRFPSHEYGDAQDLADRARRDGWDGPLFS